MNTLTKNRHGRRSSNFNQRHTSSYNKQNHRKFSGNFRRRNISGENRRHNKGGRKMSTFNPLQFINKNPSEVIQKVYTPKHDFNTFGLNSKLVQRIASLKLKIPTPIQDQIIPEILKGNDVIGLAETGTGKTAAFLIPLIEKTLKDKSRQTLILAPTRELAIQINEELYKLSRGFGVYSTICVGGINIRPQIKSLRRTNHFIIGTPGRVLDLIKRKDFIPTTVTTVVLDEADRMLDMGFIHDMKAIISETPKERETLLFSATMSKDTDKLANIFLRNPITVSVKKKDVTDSISQDVVTYNNNKFETLISLLNEIGRAHV